MFRKLQSSDVFAHFKTNKIEIKYGSVQWEDIISAKLLTWGISSQTDYKSVKIMLI